MIPTTFLRAVMPKATLRVWFSTVAIALSLSALPAFAADPFRTSNPRNIGDITEQAFITLFKQGDYDEAKRVLDEAVVLESGEPLAHAMRASLAYTEQDWQTLKIHADKTISAAEQLQTLDPVRGNMYLAVGHFLAGTYLYKIDGPLRALPKLQQVFAFLDAAENQGANDPELNLLKGYMDLLLAVNLPFSSPDQAIERLQQNAAPTYLVDRGIAVAYRDLDQLDEALTFADKALQATPENPELHYLKGQILRKQGLANQDVRTMQQAYVYFDRALAKSEQLPRSVVKSIEYEHRKAQQKISELGGTLPSQSTETTSTNPPES